MAATLSNAPDSPAYNGNDILITVETDLQTAAAGYIDLIFSSTGPVLAEVFEMSWGASTLTFTVEATTNSTATAIPTKGAETIQEYAERVADAFRENYQINDEWLVSVHTGARVRLTFATAGVLVITATEGLTNTAMTAVDGVDNTVTNLAAYVEIWQAGETFSDDVRLDALHGNYGPMDPDTETAETNFNLKEFFQLGPVLPAANSIGSTISFSWRRGVATGAWAEYYFRLADKFGIPAVPQALARSAENYIVLHGARPEDHDLTVLGGIVRVLHGYRRPDGVFRKPVSDTQPDWLYLFTDIALTSCNIEFEVTYTDGTSDLIPYTGTAFTLAANKVHWLRSTPYGAFDPASSGAAPWYYTFRLHGDAGSGDQTLVEVYYELQPCTDWDLHLMMDNGLGGCESVLLHGKTSFQFEASRELARSARSGEFDLSVGELFHFDAEAQKVFEFNTGWHQLYYIKHLRQLLLGKVWLIDTTNKRFLSLVIETNNVITHEDDEQLYSLTLTFKTAWLDKAQNP